MYLPAGTTGASWRGPMGTSSRHRIDKLADVGRREDNVGPQRTTREDSGGKPPNGRSTSEELEEQSWRACARRPKQREPRGQRESPTPSGEARPRARDREPRDKPIGAALAGSDNLTSRTALLLPRPRSPQPRPRVSSRQHGRPRCTSRYSQRRRPRRVLRG